MEFVSGEVFFRSAGPQTNFVKGLLQSSKQLANLHNFLGFDANTALQLSQSKKFLDSLKNIRRLNKAVADTAIKHDIEHITQFFETSCKLAREEAGYTMGKTREELIQFQQTADAQIMQFVLIYFAILKEELNATRERVDKDAGEFLIMKQQAKRLRDVQIFSRHLRMETQGKVALEIIDMDSPQAKRCAKAVRENINKNRLHEFGYSDVKILNVFKLEHTHLSKQLQRSNDKTVGSIKIKGLFCSLPKNGLYGFSAYGLYAQAFGSGIAFPQPPLPAIFQLPWFCTELSGSTEPIRANTIESSRVVDGRNKAHGLKSSNSKPRGTAESLARSNVDLYLRFSKYSNPSHAALHPSSNAATSENDDGTFISLCRVLVKKLRTVDDEFTENHIRNAVNDGYDAIYSKSREEYILLRPEYVLPEFIMHLRLLGRGNEKEVTKDVPSSSILRATSNNAMEQSRGGSSNGGSTIASLSDDDSTGAGPSIHPDTMGGIGAKSSHHRDRSHSPHIHNNGHGNTTTAANASHKPSASLRRISLPSTLSVTIPLDDDLTTDDGHHDGGINDNTALFNGYGFDTNQTSQSNPQNTIYMETNTVGKVFMRNALVSAENESKGIDGHSMKKTGPSLRSQIAHLDSLSSALRQKQNIVKSIEGVTQEFSHQRMRILKDACDSFSQKKMQQ